MEITRRAHDAATKLDAIAAELDVLALERGHDSGRAKRMATRLRTESKQLRSFKLENHDKLEFGLHDLQDPPDSSG